MTFIEIYDIITRQDIVLSSGVNMWTFTDASENGKVRIVATNTIGPKTRLVLDPTSPIETAEHIGDLVRSQFVIDGQTQRTMRRNARNASPGKAFAF